MFETYGVRSLAFGSDAAFAYGYNAISGNAGTAARFHAHAPS